MDKILNLPERVKKPREKGITHVLDKGLGLNEITDMLESGAEYIDIIKLGWGTAYVTANLEKKIALYQKYNIPVCCGGTLFEAFVIQNKFSDYLKLLKKLKITHIEISNGSIEMSLEQKLAYIKKLKNDFTVLSEVGSKDESVTIPPFKWVEYIKQELEAGAWKIITEARESGTIGIYQHSGEVKSGLIEEIVRAIPAEHLIFEAPQKSQQSWFIKKFGSNVNLGNIAYNDVIACETLRLGLRGDTLAEFMRVREQ